jgi:nucleotide-binding universal stress UspA family protein
MLRRGATQAHGLRIAGSDDATGVEARWTDIQKAARARIAATSCSLSDTTDEGALVDTLMMARDRELDLLIIGRRLLSSEWVNEERFIRIARKSPCSTMVVPEYSRAHFARVLIATDCSDHSPLTVRTGMELIQGVKEPNPQLLLLNVRSVELGYERAGVTLAEAMRVRLDHGRRSLDELLRRIDTKGLALETEIVMSLEPAAAIAEMAAVRKMDIVVVGSRGLSRPAAVLLGSVSEQVLRCCPLPVIVAKEKGETLPLLSALIHVG